MADITYILNDPSTPNLIIPVDLPSKPALLDFKIDGFRGPTTGLYTLEHQAACCHFTIVNAINIVNKYIPNAFSRWAATANLFVQPRAGKQFNAFYDRRSIRFFYGTDPVTKKIVYAVNSTDIVTHEFGHAVLDSLRPDLFNMQAMEIWAFHEAFADIFAIINLLHHDMILDFVLEETKNDLRLTNVATKLAEEMGTAIFHTSGGRSGHTSGMLRNAVNGFRYMLPEKLPKAGKDHRLTSEPHSFSRVFTGAWYDILVSMYESLKNRMSPKEALIEARDTLSKYTFSAIPIAPAIVRFYKGFAKAMLVADKANNSQYNQLINNVFLNRNILRKFVSQANKFNLTWKNFKHTLEPSDEVLTKPNVVAVRNKKTELLSLSNYMLNVETPSDDYYEFDNKGVCIDAIQSSSAEIVEHAHKCVDFLYAKGMIRSDKLTPFEIDQEGNLVRTHFAGCFNDNAQKPGQPEYGKPYKPENSKGCGCSQVSEQETEDNSETGTTVVTTNYTRSDFLPG